MKAIVIYVTFKDKTEAERVASVLVEEQLVACANIFAPHASIYRWDGKVERAEEVAVIFKTRHNLFEAARAMIAELHSYECPCIVSWPIEKGHGPFLEWVKDQT